MTNISDVGQRRIKRMKNKTINVFTVAVLLIAHASFIFANEKLNEYLKKAIEDTDVQQVRSLLEKGADPNYRRMTGSMLETAVQDHVQDTDEGAEIVDLLIKAGADVNVNKGAALSWAVGWRKVKTVESLIKAKANVNIDTPIIRVVTKDRLLPYDSNDIKLLKMLLDAGSDPNIVPKNGTPPILTLVQNGVYFSERSNQEGIYLYQQKQAIEACEASKEMVKILAAAKANLNVSDGVYTPLSYCIEKGKKDWVELLTKLGADEKAKVSIENIQSKQVSDSNRVPKDVKVVFNITLQKKVYKPGESFPVTLEFLTGEASSLSLNLNQNTVSFLLFRPSGKECFQKKFYSGMSMVGMGRNDNYETHLDLKDQINVSKGHYKLQFIYGDTDGVVKKAGEYHGVIRSNQVDFDVE